MENEEWRDVKGYEGIYQVSNLGRVKSLPREICNGRRCIISKERFLKAGINNNGYETVVLCKNKDQKSKKVHKLVAVEFLNHTPCGYELVVDHINDVKTDNRVENLQLVTARFNVRKTPKEHYSSKFKGVSLDKKSNKWLAQIRVNGKKKNLGLFTCELEASEKYQEELEKLVIN